MKKSKLDAVLRRKVRIKITRRKRGRFEVLIPQDMLDKGEYCRPQFTSKREALVWLYTKLRCIQPLIIYVDEISRCKFCTPPSPPKATP